VVLRSRFSQQPTRGLCERLKIPWTYQVTFEGERDFVEDGVRVCPASRFLAALV